MLVSIGDNDSIFTNRLHVGLPEKDSNVPKTKRLKLNDGVHRIFCFTDSCLLKCCSEEHDNRLPSEGWW